ncbi:hypothetical protein F3Y22_tig00110009pilonHSYRG00262 [Hibiscus syriacus]|uniref:Uncharacterized protein n=1 Tax=Hibiscus syriacus TaxID=106335 RepID=A0A6A3BNK9_HIBSY|nr:hypothetical protein F3Y22_tig00110009pilonHSYRG00262 [Hibiscus syriacus]
MATRVRLECLFWKLLIGVAAVEQRGDGGSSCGGRVYPRNIIPIREDALDLQNVKDHTLKAVQQVSLSAVSNIQGSVEPSTDGRSVVRSLDREFEGWFSEGDSSNFKSRVVNRRAKRLLLREALEQVNISTVSSLVFPDLLEENLATWWVGKRNQFPRASITELERKIHKLEEEIRNLQDVSDNGIAIELNVCRSELWRLHRIEEQIWHQNSRMKWVYDGDRNTRFFHTCASVRRKKNAMNALRVEGHIIQDPTVIKVTVRDHFFKIFNVRSTLEVDDIRFWYVLKEDILKVFHNFYLGKDGEHGINHTFITLFPKGSSIGCLDDYRPISLVEGVVKEWAESIGCSVGSFSSDYLGLPLISIRNSSALWDLVVQKFHKKLAASVYKTLNSIISNFLWGRGNGKNKIHWVNWSSVCKSKNEGGLGVWNLNSMNKELLGKWYWRKVPPQASWIWRSMVNNHFKDDTFVSKFQNLCSFQVGDGKFIRFWQDSWALDYPFLVIFPSLFSISSNKFGKLFEFGEFQSMGWIWDVQVRRNLNDWELEQWSNLMVIIPNYSLSKDSSDVLIWKGNGDGVYSVSSCVKLYSSGLEEVYFWENIIWKGLLPPRVESFMWQVVLQRQDVKNELLKNRVQGIKDVLYPLCSFKESSSLGPPTLLELKAIQRDVYAFIVKDRVDRLRVVEGVVRWVARITNLVADVLAKKLMYQQESGLFYFRRMEVSPLLLIVDRRDDLVTPLLNQWTNQAMVPELIGIQDNKVELRSVGKFPLDQQEVMPSSEQDAFFKANICIEKNDASDWGKGMKNIWEMHIPSDHSSWEKRSLTNIVKQAFELELLKSASAKEGIEVQIDSWGYIWKSCVIIFNSDEEMKEALKKEIVWKILQGENQAGFDLYLFWFILKFLAENFFDGGETPSESSEMKAYNLKSTDKTGTVWLVEDACKKVDSWMEQGTYSGFVEIGRGYQFSRKSRDGKRINEGMSDLHSFGR